MTKLRLGDLLDPAGYARRKEKSHQHEHELNLKAKIAGAQLSQSAQQHYENMELGRAKLDLDAQVESRKLSQNDQHHAEKLRALERRDTAEITLGQDRLSFDRESALLKAETARETALINAHASMEVARIGQDGALALAQQNHSNAMDMAREQAHLEIIGKARGVAYESISSSLRRGEETNRAFSGAYAQILADKVRGKIAERMEDKKESHRANERQHEVARDRLVMELEKLRSDLRSREFSHAQHTSRVEIPLILRELGLGEGSDKPTDAELTAWIDKLRTRGTI